MVVNFVDLQTSRLSRFGRNTAAVAGNMGLALSSAAIGKGGSATVSEKEAVANPQHHRALVGTGLGSVRDIFMQTLQSAR